jgi:hypothetical protein
MRMATAVIVLFPLYGTRGPQLHPREQERGKQTTARSIRSSAVR